MKIFGIEIGNTAPKSIEGHILEEISRLKSTPSGSRHYEISKRLQALCLDNPDVVASLVFGNRLNELDKEKLLFTYSSDHWGSCRLTDNPLWARMMSELIIPNADKLPEDCRQQLWGYRFK